MIRRQLIPAVFWCVALAVAIGSYSLTNDHFGRISPAWQIVAFGELPFRDYLDPGYYLTELSSAAVQRLLGHNLLGELLLNTGFIATGSLCVLLLARRVSQSTLVGIVAASIALLSLPRAYDYDKVLFYPLGLLVTWRYFEQPRLARLLVLAATIVTAGLFRYDNGVFLGIAAVTGLLVLHGVSRTALRESATLVGLTLLLCSPVMVFIQWNGGLVSAVDQMLTYGVREGTRTRLTTLPRVSLGRWVSIAEPSPPGTTVVIRWAPQVDALGRAEGAVRLGLSGEKSLDADARTWSYRILDESPGHVRRIVTDPAVEDTAGIDRGRMQLEDPTSAWDRLTRRVPLMRTRLLPDFWSGDNASAVLFYLFIAIPVGALVMIPSVHRNVTRSEMACVASLLTLSVLGDIFILREPIGARAAAVVGPPLVLAVWIVDRIGRRGGWVTLAARVGTVAVAGIVLVAFSVTSDWVRQLVPLLNEPMRIVNTIEVMATPPSLALLPASRDEAMASYVARCTQRQDRVFASWFFPELYWFAERGFAGGMVVTFGHHWSEPRFQRRTVRLFELQQPPIVLIQTASASEFRDVYDMLDAHLTARYRVGGASNFGDPTMPPDAYEILVPANRAPVRTDPQWGLPCFA